MSESGFTILDHPSDLGLEAWGPSMRDAFARAAEGLISKICDPTTVATKDQRRVRVDGSDYEQLLVRWLSEILYLYDGQQFIGRSFRIMRIERTCLEAVVEGAQYDPQVHVLRTDVKAVTYHQLRIAETPDRCTVTVYLDV